MTLLEGEVFRGTLDWFDGLSWATLQDGKTHIHVFRHALHRVKIES